MVDCVGKPRIFIQCTCLIAYPCGYESALWRTRMLLPNTRKKIADWLLRGFIHCIQVLIARSITHSMHKLGGAVGMTMHWPFSCPNLKKWSTLWMVNQGLFLMISWVKLNTKNCSHDYSLLSMVYHCFFSRGLNKTPKSSQKLQSLVSCCWLL